MHARKSKNISKPEELDKKDNSKHKNRRTYYLAIEKKMENLTSAKAGITKY